MGGDERDSGEGANSEAEQLRFGLGSTRLWVLGWIHFASGHNG